MNIAIVVSEFNNKVTSRMHKVALEKAKELKLNVKYECKVPGVFDMPLVIDALLQKKDIDAVVTLGAIIKGQTKHDEIIADVVATRISKLSIKHQKPVSLGISVQECLKGRHLQEFDQYQKGQLRLFSIQQKN